MGVSVVMVVCVCVDVVPTYEMAVDVWVQVGVGVSVVIVVCVNVCGIIGQICVWYVCGGMSVVVCGLRTVRLDMCLHGHQIYVGDVHVALCSLREWHRSQNCGNDGSTTIHWWCGEV